MFSIQLFLDMNRSLLQKDTHTGFCLPYFFVKPFPANMTGIWGKYNNCCFIKQKNRVPEIKVFSHSELAIYFSKLFLEHWLLPHLVAFQSCRDYPDQCLASNHILSLVSYSSFTPVADMRSHMLKKKHFRNSFAPSAILLSKKRFCCKPVTISLPDIFLFFSDFATI